MRRVKPRVPEADETQGAIIDEAQLDMEGYSRFCKRYLAGEYQKLVSFFVNDLGLNPQGRVLEIGPGPGWIGICLAKELPSVGVVGLELSPDMRRVAQRNIQQEGVASFEVVPGDASAMPFEDDSFDGVISNGSLHHWLAPVATFDEVARVLKPEGVFVISDGRRDLSLGAEVLYQLLSGFALLDWSVPGRQMRRGWRTSIEAGYTALELRALLDASRLSIAVVREQLFDVSAHSPLRS
ncbi:MAG: methyltransferase domain-containing protein [Polyangiaceae bacterium]|nr:methyltransferase domain-containing protein [Polyangiaceae bacterium]